MEEIKIHSLRDKQKEKMKRTENFFQKKPEEVTVSAPLVVKRKSSAMKTVAKLLVFTAFVFTIGGMGGIWIDRIFLPTLLIKYPDLNQYDYLKSVSERTTVVHETREINISQEEAISTAIDRVGPAVVGILNKNANGQFDQVGSGIILTSDGYIITPLKNIFTGNAQSKEIQVKLKNGKTFSARLAAQSPDYSLAMLKIEENNLSVIPYASSEDLKLGQKLVIINDAVTTDIISKLLDNYKAPNSTDSGLQKRIQLSQNLSNAFIGSAVINLEGKLVGVEQEADIVIPLGEIRTFIDQSVTK